MDTIADITEPQSVDAKKHKSRNEMKWNDGDKEPNTATKFGRFGYRRRTNFQGLSSLLKSFAAPRKRCT